MRGISGAVKSDFSRDEENEIKIITGEIKKFLIGNEIDILKTVSSSSINPILLNNISINFMNKKLPIPEMIKSEADYIMGNKSFDEDKKKNRIEVYNKLISLITSHS